MKNTFGQNVALTLFGESHSEYIGAVLDGLAPGIEVNEAFITHQLSKRKPKGPMGTKRCEKDEFKIISGVFKGKTTGTPICVLIPNKDTDSQSYEASKYLMRPSHADYSAFCKYHSFQDYRGGGHFSGRLTCPIVALGAIAISALRSKGIFIGTHIKSCGGISDRSFEAFKEDFEALENKNIPVLDEKAEEKITNRILEISKNGDSLGGILETAITGLSAGVGEPYFDSLESVLSHAMFSIPGVKGVEFGLGFGFSESLGSEANDEFYYENGIVKTYSNNNGGINGGISNGMPITFNCVIKPTPSIFKEQKTVDIKAKQNTTLKIQGRHDPAIISRASVIVESVTALCLCDVLSQRYGTDYFLGE